MHTLSLQQDSLILPLPGARRETGSAPGATRSETVTVLLQGDPAALNATVEAIAQLLVEAARPGAAPVYLVCQMTPGEPWRSRIQWGGLEAAKPGLGGRTVGLKLTLECDPFWEGQEAQLALSNGNASQTLAALPVFNANDAAGLPPEKRHNWLEIAPGAVTGDLLTPARIEMTNAFDLPIGWVWMGQNWSGPGDTVDVLEAEAAVGVTPQPEAQTSGGAYVTVTIPPDAQVDVLRWQLTPAMLQSAWGWLRAMLYFRLTSAMCDQVTFRFAVRWNTATLWQGEALRPDDRYGTLLRDLGLLRLAPGLAGLANPAGVELVLTAEQHSPNPISLDIDCLYLVPLDGWRWMLATGYGAPRNHRIVDDGLTGHLFRDDGAGGERAAIFTGCGAPLLLKPQSRQRIYFFFHGIEIDASSVDHQVGVKVFYRPRKAVL